MDRFRNSLFIVNPTSGRKKFNHLNDLIASSCKVNNLEFNINTTERPGHATEIARESINKNIDIVFAVGGDGTVNEVAKGLVHSPVVMGIIPKGSGNGLARHLGIPQQLEKSFAALQTGEIISMDTVKINGEISVNVSGIGFDGRVANLFGKSGKRGLREYVALSLKEFSKFKTFPVDGLVDNQPITDDAFILAFANSSQFGNNATLSPMASVCDGVMDVCLIKKVPLHHAMGFGLKMFTNQLHRSAFVKIINGKTAEFNFSSPLPFHIDGEGRGEAQHFRIELQHSSLRVLAGKKAV